MYRAPKYRRALLKVSGEALAGERGFGLELSKTRWIAGQIADAHRMGVELGVVVGGGNIMRGLDSKAVGVPALVGDEMGMLATVLNALALHAALEQSGVPARVLSAFPVGRIVEPFQRAKAREYLRHGSAAVLAGGTGNPCFTTDTAAALRAVELGAEVLVKATQVDGVFDKDPRTHADAVMFRAITYREVLERRLGVIDAAAMALLSNRGIPTIVLNLHVDGTIARALAGEEVGTIIT